MSGNVTAKAQTANELDLAARVLKRHIRESREILGAVRRAQAAVIGVEVETIETHSPQGGHSGIQSTPQADHAR